MKEYKYKELIIKALERNIKYYETKMQEAEREEDYKNAMYYLGCVFALVKFKLDFLRVELK